MDETLFNCKTIAPLDDPPRLRIGSRAEQRKTLIIKVQSDDHQSFRTLADTAKERRNCVLGKVF